MSESLGSKIIKGTIWSASDRFGVMALQFIVNMVLAHLLTPTDFGAIGMLYIFIALSMTLIDGGFGSALIQKKDPSETDYATIFFWNLGIGVVLYGALYCAAPAIARFYRMPVLINVLRTIGIILIFSSISNIQNNRLRKKLQFKDLAISNIGTYICSGTIAIIMAYKGFGVWSLVAMMVTQNIGRVIWLYLVSKWIPRFTFSIQAFKSLFSFGGYLFFSFVLESICKNIQGLVIGKKFSAAQMGYYSQASKLDNITSYSIPQTIASVMYPVMSQFQDDKLKLNNLIATNLRIISSLIYPLLSLLILIAYPLIELIYGSQWMISVRYYKILCVGAFFMCINNIPYYAVAARGKSKALLLASFYKWGCLGIFILIGMQFGMDGIVWSLSLSTANIFLSNLWLARKYVGFGFKECVRALYPALITSILSFVIVWEFNNLYQIYWILNLCGFILCYILLTLLINKQGMNYIISLINKIK